MNSDGSLGVDLGKNWDDHWEKYPYEKMTEVPTSPIYRGPKPFSEPETRALKTLIESVVRQEQFLFLQV